MKRNILILVISIIILVIMILIISPNKKTENVQKEITNEDINYDEETNLYYIRDEETGEIVTASEDENSFDLYKQDPDYNPNPLIERKTDLQSYVQHDEQTEENDLEINE